MKKFDLFSYSALIITVLFAGFGGYYIKAQYPEVRIIEKKIIEKVEVKDGKIACTPCVDEPIIALSKKLQEQCKFDALAYEAVRDRYDIYGQQELISGDIYYLKNVMFDADNYKFCAENGNCFSEEVILNKNLFKPLK